jgi:hypothetical protein
MPIFRHAVPSFSVTLKGDRPMGDRKGRPYAWSGTIYGAVIQATIPMYRDAASVATFL